jgi:hypothetical protein
LYEQKDELNQKILGTRIYVFRWPSNSWLNR